MSKKRNALTLRHKIALIHEAESGKSCRQLADQFKIGRTQATSIIKRKADLLLEYDQNNSLDCKRKLQKTGNEDVNIICWEWFQTARAQNIPLSGPMLQEKALSYAKELGNAEFKASNGWLESFRKRHNIAFNVISGEAADVSSETSMIGRSEFHRSSIATSLKTSTTATRRGCSIGPCLTGHCRSKDNNVKAANDQRNA